MKSVLIRSFSGPNFPPFGLNTERYGAFLRIQSKPGKIRTRKTPNTNTFHPVLVNTKVEIIIIIAISLTIAIVRSVEAEDKDKNSKVVLK